MPTLAKPPARSQDYVADAFAARYAGKFKYVATAIRVRWFIRNDETQAWDPDVTFFVRDCIRALCRELAPDADPVLAREICSNNFVAGVETFCGLDRAFAATKAELGIGPKVKGAKRQPKTEAVPP